MKNAEAPILPEEPTTTEVQSSTQRQTEHSDGPDEQRTKFMADVGPGPKYHSSDIYIIGGEAIKFVYRTGAYLDDAAAARAVKDRGRATFPSHRFNNTKYWIELDTRSNSFLLMGWYSRDTGRYGWVGVLNTPDTWWFRKNGTWSKIHSNNGSNFGDWQVGNRIITLFAKNPNNVGGWTPDDIIYRYGWSFTATGDDPDTTKGY